VHDRLVGIDGPGFSASLEAGGLLVGEKVTLEFELSAVKTA